MEPWKAESYILVERILRILISGFVGSICTSGLLMGPFLHGPEYQNLEHVGFLRGSVILPLGTQSTFSVLGLFWILLRETHSSFVS